MELKEIRNILASAAEAAGISEYEIFYMTERSLSTETLKDEISAFNSLVVGGVSFRCVCDGKLGAASTELLDGEELAALVGRAVSNAQNIENDDDAILFAGSEQYATPAVREYQLPSAAELTEAALALQKQTYAQSEAVTDGTQTAMFSSQTEMHLMNSHGLSLSNSVGVDGGYVQAVVRREEEAEDHFEMSEGRDAASLSDLPGKAVAGALAKLGAGEIESGSYDVIISARQMRSLLSVFSSAFSAKNAQMGLSLLRGKEGQRIAADCVSIVDDPMYAGSPMQTAFDGEGVATYAKSVVENGVLKTLLYDLATAKKAGVASTANGQRAGYAQPVTIAPYHFYLKPGNRSCEELMACVQDGVYITEMKGLHAGADAVTGDFSIECGGFRIRDGKQCEAIRAFTVAGNFFELLQKVEALSCRTEFGFPAGFTVYGSPEVLLRGMSVGGK